MDKALNKLVIYLVSTGTSLITAENFEGIAPKLEQSNSSNAAKTHALMVEQLGAKCTIEQSKGTAYILFNGKGRKKENVMEATFIPCGSSKDLLYTQKI